jgi:hypothetical protein
MSDAVDALRERMWMPEDEDPAIRERLASDVVERARVDHPYRRLALEHPHEACAQFGLRIPESLRSRGRFYVWYFKAIVNEIRGEPPGAEAGAPDRPGSLEDMDWDFEIADHRPAGRR